MDMCVTLGNSHHGTTFTSSFGLTGIPLRLAARMTCLLSLRSRAMKLNEIRGRYMAAQSQLVIDQETIDLMEKSIEAIPYLLGLVERLLAAAEETVKRPMGVEPHSLSDIKRELEGKDGD
jgi:hypothetical protein